METETRSIHAFREGDLFDNRYRLVKRAGSGGFADVWKAEDTQRDNKVVALKIYTRLDEEDFKEMSAEYDRMEDIQHPNLLTGKHFAKMGNIPYLEMRYCDGGNLSRKAGKMSSEDLRKVVLDVCNGLEYLHAEGIIHQDIKPENILYDSKHNRYLLSDFGISGKSRSHLSRSVNKANLTLSMTEAYAPPEKFSGNLADIEPDSKGDIFSLGMTVFELATGQLPFTPPMATGREMLYSQGRLQLDYSKIQDPQLRHIVECCTKYRKDERPTAEEVNSMLTMDASSGNRGENGRETKKIVLDNVREEQKDSAVAEAKELKRWNWGAFVFGGLWGLFNGVPLYLLEVIVFAGLFILCWNIYSTQLWWRWNIDTVRFINYWLIIHLLIRVGFGFMGTRRSWKAKRAKWKSFENFNNVQKVWGKIGVALFVLFVLLGVCVFLPNLLSGSILEFLNLLGLVLFVVIVFLLNLLAVNRTTVNDNGKSSSFRKKLYIGIAAAVAVVVVLLLLFSRRNKNDVHVEDDNLVFVLDGTRYDYNMVHVDGGTFLMGCTSKSDGDCDSIELPVHEVTLSDYYMGQTEVTQALWMAVMGGEPNYYGGWTNGMGRGDNYPAYRINYDEISVFIRRLNRFTGCKFRLPTEAEWEYAARGGSNSKGYKYCGSNNLDAVAWYAENSEGTTHPVAQKQPNELGLYDMSGNVWELCSDWFGDYEEYVLTNPQGPLSGYGRVTRGGSWSSFYGAESPSQRTSNSETERDRALGFRLVREE